MAMLALERRDALTWFVGASTDRAVFGWLFSQYSCTATVAALKAAAKSTFKTGDCAQSIRCLHPC